MIRFARIESPLGPLRVCADAGGLVSLSFPSSRDSTEPDPAWIEDPAFLGAARSALEAYWNGRPLGRFARGAVRGTPFQRKVWAAIEAIPFGETRSYGELAESIGHPGAARAVGAACGANPLPLFVPCHRVLGARGALGGFSCGLEVKRRLLRHEGVL